MTDYESFWFTGFVIRASISPFSPMPIITLTTDFGLSDSYVAQMKGVILTLSPEATLVDVTHQIPPQDCVAASAILADAVGAFPPETIHLVVVDPGVGTDRRAVAVETTGGRDGRPAVRVAPDNGVLSGVLENLSRPSGRATGRATVLARRDLAHVSRPGHLRAGGRPLEPRRRSGRIRTAARIAARRASRRSAGRRRRQTSGPNRADRFFRQPDYEHRCVSPSRGGPRAARRRSGQPTHPGHFAILRREVAGGLLALFGSSGRLEIAVRQGHAGEILAAWSGDPVIVRGLSCEFE